MEKLDLPENVPLGQPESASHSMASSSSVADCWPDKEASSTDDKPKVCCRLCAEDDIVGPEDRRWVKISDKWLQTADTVEFIMRKYFPAGLMIQFPNEASLQHICSECFLSLQQIKDFIDKIVKGQAKLARLFQLQRSHLKLEPSETIQSESKEVPRKRGRPRKDANSVSKSASKEIAVSNVEQRSKRTSRPPTRYGSDVYQTEEPLNPPSEIVDDASTKEIGDLEKSTTSVLDDQSIFNTDFESVPGMFTEVTVGGPSDNFECLANEPNDNTNVNAPGNASNTRLTGAGNEEGEPDVSNDNEMVHSDDDDVTFKLSSFNRSHKPGKRRKCGRPKRRKQQEFKCDLCEKVYTAYASLVYHQLSHQTDRMDFSCTLCSKKFAHKALLTNHLFTHSSVRNFICEEDDCKASFKSRGSLFNHKKAVHDTGKGKMFTCENCGRQFAFKSALLAHQKTMHTGEKPFSCMYCDKSFSHRGNMKEHVRTHTKERPYICDISECGKSFTTASQLNSHKMRHASRKPFLCVECGKDFSQRSGLVSHMKSHKGESEECFICHKKFIDSAALKKHQRTHSGEKPFQCDICKKSFADPSNYRKHKQTHPNFKEVAGKSITRMTDSSQRSVSGALQSTSRDKVKNAVSTSLISSEIENDTQSEHLGAGTQPGAESLVQILTSEELAALGAGTSSDDGNIIFLYQPDDLFAVEENQTVDIPVQQEETVVLQEVEMEGLGDVTQLSFEHQEEISTQDAEKMD